MGPAARYRPSEKASRGLPWPRSKGLTAQTFPGQSIVRVIGSVSAQPSSKPAQRISDPSPDHSPSSSDASTALPAGTVALGGGAALSRTSTSR